MYRNRRNKGKNVAKENVAEKRPLNTIDEDRSVKVTRSQDKSNNGASNDYDRGNEGGLEEMFSEDNIPASQEPTQRYLSQRSNIAASLMRTQSRNLSQRPPNTYFELVLMKAGVQLDEGENFVLSCDHVTFVCKFREILIKSQNYPENVERFQSGVRDALAAKSKFTQKLLSGSTVSIPGEESVYQSQDSMIANFLMIDFLCDPVLEVLLEKIEEAACSNSVLRVSNTQIPLLPLLLMHLRYVIASHSELIYQRIKEIFRKSTDAAKWDIISSAELIIDPNYHDDFADLLLDNVKETKNFFHSTTIETLSNLCLSMRIHEKIRSKIIEYIKDEKCSNELLPQLVKFLLQILNNNRDDGMPELAKTLREIIMCKAGTDLDAKGKQHQLQLFKYITQALTCCNKFYSVWQKTIATLPSYDFRSIDFVMLLILTHIKEDNSLYIENILRRRIKLEHIDFNILIEAKRKYAAILVLHTNTLMEILHDFLREKHKAVAEFARASYGILFQICESTQKNILKKLLELTCDKSAINMTDLSLGLLKDVQRKYPKEVQNWGTLLLPLLDRLSEMTLSQTRTVMELLCSIAFPGPDLAECPALQDQIDMMVKKQIINRGSFVKKQGIIGSVQLIDSMARIEETKIEMDDADTTFSSSSDLPEGRGKMAAVYIERIQSATVDCPESLALFFDELASVCSAPHHERVNNALLDKPFLIWFSEQMTFLFQNSFVAEHQPGILCGIELSVQKCINSVSDSNTEQSELPPIAINIGELVLQPKSNALSSIIVLAPLFNLVRVLSLQRYEGSLEIINALLGCSIILPKFFDNSNTDAIFYDYDSTMQSKILDIYFHCANWMRETVCSFATQREDMIRRKVLQRLADLIQIEEKIRHLLQRAPHGYTPPLSNFISTDKNPTAGRGRAAAAANQKKTTSKSKGTQPVSESMCMNETNLQSVPEDVTKLVATIANKANKKNFENMYGPLEIYRQLDSEIMLLLKEKFTLDYPMLQSDIGSQIGLLEFRYIMTDLVSKLESITDVQKFHSDQNLQYIAKPYYFMCDLSKFLKSIVEKMQMISQAIDEQLESVERVYTNADLLTEEFTYLKSCFGLCLRLLSAYFSWSEFADETRNDLLKKSFSAFMDHSKWQKYKGETTAVLAGETFKEIAKMESSVVNLSTAVHLYQFLVTLKKLSTTSASPSGNVINDQALTIRNTCKILLCRKWINYDGTLEKGALCNVYLDKLVKGFLLNSNFRRQREIFNIVLEESKHLNGKNTSLKSFPNITKANFPLLFRGLCDTFINSLNDVMNTTDCDDRLAIWEESCDLVNLLLDIAQLFDKNRTFQLFLKYSHFYLKLVLQHGIPIYEQYLRNNTERVCVLLRKLQISTRFLHNLCCHSKAEKNTVILGQIPFLRETIENLVFRVKAMLAANKVASVFFMANLKNQDLYGDIIISQTATLSSTVTDSDEEMPEDDISVDETILDGVSSINSKGSSHSISKCF